MGKVLLLTLRVFSDTGGIEKVSKVAGKAIHGLCEENGGEISVCSMYDESGDIDEKYFPTRIFRGFGIRKLEFIRSCVTKGIKSDVVILSHINLLIVGYLVKLFSPKTKLMLLAHGIEVWSPLSYTRKKMLAICDKVICVSKYTKETVMQVNSLGSEKFTVLNNCLDPFLQEHSSTEKDPVLLSRYHLSPGNKVLMTLTRLSAKEKYKGYDQVIQSLPQLLKQHPDLKYLLVGKYDKEEKQRLDIIIEKLNVQDIVIFTGYVPDEELAAHFSLADIYIMPSLKEGFGIVFIEAMYYGIPVIGGNKDGSTDALLHGKLGTLIDPNSREELQNAVHNILADKKAFVPDRRLLMENFSFEAYKGKWKDLTLGPSPKGEGGRNH